jgi:Arc/MetJ-type ribon-helix-helix transcriptional regulator
MPDLQGLHIKLTKEQSEAMQAAVAAGEYSSPEQIVQPSLDDWKWQREWAGLESSLDLRELWQQGIASGPGQSLDVDQS